MRGQINSSSVNVEVDGGPQEDLSRIMEEIRSQYEGITEKNRREMEAWYKVKVRYFSNGKKACSYHHLMTTFN